MSRAEWTMADSMSARGADITTHTLEVVGTRPKHRPYLRVATLDGAMVCSVPNAHALRALAHRILRALGDE